MSMSYKIGEIQKVRVDFRRLFDTDFVPFYDGLVTVTFGRICIDLFLFDDYLHKMYGEYEDRGLSIQGIILEKYGKEGDELINNLM
jgi:hypothetical protein